MLTRLARGEMPRKHHLACRGADGALRHEQCLTQAGFEGPYTISYHLGRPHAQRPTPTEHGWPAAHAVAPLPLAKRHLLGGRLPALSGPLVDARRPLLFNDDVTIGLAHFSAPCPVYFSNADADEVLYVHAGHGTLRTPLGEVPYGPETYVVVPRGIAYRVLPAAGSAQVFLVVECRGGVGLPAQWRNAVGQLRMDAPYCHRDFVLPEFVGPADDGVRTVVVKRQDAFHGFTQESSPLDVVGWDGSVYPFAFPIMNFQPRAGLVHLPPSWHGTFAAAGALICSFVPRPLDFHPEAVPCPYPHASVDCDEVLFYCRGNFTSRRGVGPLSLSHHPAGIAHGPHPGAYEASLGRTHTEELAVMLDTARPLKLTAAAMAVDDPNYMQSFVGG